MKSIEEKKRPQKCQRGTLKQRQEGPRHPKGGQQKNKITYSPAHDIDPSYIQEGLLKCETCIEI